MIREFAYALTWIGAGVFVVLCVTGILSAVQRDTSPPLEVPAAPTPEIDLTDIRDRLEWLEARHPRVR